MPFYRKILVNQTTSLFIWKIEEDYNTLFREVKLKDISLARLETMKSESHQKGFLAVRMLLQYLGYSDFDLSYDEFGKPHLRDEIRSTKYETRSWKEDGSLMMEEERRKQKEVTKNLVFDNQQPTTNNRHISISHSFDFSCICLSDEKVVGIDVEVLKPKIATIAPRFMDVKHLANLNQEDKIKKATVVWGVKESIFKIKNEKGISFPKHIFEDEFHLRDSFGNAQLKFNNIVEDYYFRFEFIENYALVCAFENKE